MTCLPARAALTAALVLIATPVAAQDAQLRKDVESAFATAGPGTRFGLVVTTLEGEDIVAIAPDERFSPASNTKLFSTIAAFDVLRVDGPDQAGGAAVRLERNGRGAPGVVLTGHGDARLSSAADCAVDCLSELADAVAAQVRVVGDVTGDDSLFPDERWAPGVNWDDVPSRYGTAISALTLDDNELQLRVLPGRPGERAVVEGLGYYRIDNDVMTVAQGGEARVRSDRMPITRDVRLKGAVVAGQEPVIVRLSIDDPAHYAAWRLAEMLKARGVRVTGNVTVRHRPLAPADDPAVRGGAPAAKPPAPEFLARLTPAPLIEDVTLTNKVSQNLHADLLLRRASVASGSGSIADGLAVVSGILSRAQVEPWRVDLYDGSGMSSYNRVSPRGLARLLHWTTTQPWSDAFRATLPVGGVDGTLARRFKQTPLEGKVFAKTGTLSVSSALSGFMTAASGRVLIFSLFANEMPRGQRATDAMDAALNVVAAAN